jgi:hypothetical protein
LEVRKIEKELVDFIDKKLEKNGLAQDALARKDARALMVQAASALVGIKEATGRNDGKMVKLLQETVGGASGEPWCASMIQSLIAYAEVKTGKKSPIIASELCFAMWHKSPKTSRVKLLPLAGAIAIWNDVGKTTGHTEMVLSCDGQIFQAVGGNTGGTTTPGEPVEANGNGVYYTVRSMKGTKKRALLGFLKPF